jgi:hypothetical protein
VAFALLFGLHLAASWAVARRPRRTSSALLYAVVVAAGLWNVPVHTGQALLLGGYVPGLATAWLVVAPFAAGLRARIQ